MPKNDPGFFNSGLILKNLMQNQFLVGIYLEGGTTISGTLLGWDSDYLLIREDKNLQMVPMQKVLRLQVDLDELVTAQALTAATNEAPKLGSDNQAENAEPFTPTTEGLPEFLFTPKAEPLPAAKPEPTIAPVPEPLGSFEEKPTAKPLPELESELAMKLISELGSDPLFGTERKASITPELLGEPKQESPFQFDFSQLNPQTEPLPKGVPNIIVEAKPEVRPEMKSEAKPEGVPEQSLSEPEVYPAAKLQPEPQPKPNPANEKPVPMSLDDLVKNW